MEQGELDSLVDDIDDSLGVDDGNPDSSGDGGDSGGVVEVGGNDILTDEELTSEVTPPDSTRDEPIGSKGEPEKGEQAEATPADEEPADFDPNDPAEKTPKQRAGLRKALAERTRKWREREQVLLEEAARQRGIAEAMQAQGAPQNGAQQEPEVGPDDEFYNLGPAAYINQQLQQANKTQRIALSAEFMRSSHDDFDELVGEFMEMVQSDPTLETRAVNSPNPAKFAYDYAKVSRETKDISDPEAYKAKIYREAEERAEKKYRKKTADEIAENSTSSTAGTAGAGVRSQVTVSDVDDLDFNEIYKGIGIPG